MIHFLIKYIIRPAFAKAIVVNVTGEYKNIVICLINKMCQGVFSLSRIKAIAEHNQLNSRNIESKY